MQTSSSALPSHGPDVPAPTPQRPAQFLCATQSLTSPTSPDLTPGADPSSCQSLTVPWRLRPGAVTRLAAETCSQADSNRSVQIQRPRTCRQSTPDVWHHHHDNDSGIMRSAPASVLKSSGSMKRSSVNFHPGAGGKEEADDCLPTDIPVWKKEEEPLPLWMTAPCKKPPQPPNTGTTTDDPPAPSSGKPTKEHRLKFWTRPSKKKQASDEGTKPKMRALVGFMRRFTFFRSHPKATDTDPDSPGPFADRYESSAGREKCEDEDDISGTVDTSLPSVDDQAEEMEPLSDTPSETLSETPTGTPILAPRETRETLSLSKRPLGDPQQAKDELKGAIIDTMRATLHHPLRQTCPVTLGDERRTVSETGITGTEAPTYLRSAILDTMRATHVIGASGGAKDGVMALQKAAPISRGDLDSLRT